jgi:rod shape-determining protein MreC
MRLIRRRRGRELDIRDERRHTASTFIALLLACAALITVDYRWGGQGDSRPSPDSPVEPARRVTGEALGPAQSVIAAMIRPVVAVPQWFRTQGALRDDLARLEAENSRLRREAETAGLDRNRLAGYDALARTAADTGYSLAPAHVIAFGPAQSFSRTVTIDAGTDAGVQADMTVIDGDGLVGRVLRATRTTATVLLIVDADSVVGGRLGRSMEVGFLRGRGELAGEGELDLDLVDGSATPDAGDVVVTWGSDGGSPYVAGIPIGRVTGVVSTPREQSRRALIAPNADFSSLDLVGVVVAAGAAGERSLIEAGGKGGGER